MHCMFPLDSSELFSSGITKKYLFNFHGQQLRRVVCRFSYLCVSVLSNYGCFVAQYELFDNGSHARQSCHLSRAVGTGGHGVGVIANSPPHKKPQKLGGTEVKTFPSKLRQPGHLDFQNFLRPCWRWEDQHRHRAAAATGRMRGRRGPTTFWWLLKSLRCLEIISAHRNCSHGTAEHSTNWVTWLVHWLVRRRRHYFWPTLSQIVQKQLNLVIPIHYKKPT